MRKLRSTMHLKPMKRESVYDLFASSTHAGKLAMSGRDARGGGAWWQKVGTDIWMRGR